MEAFYYFLANAIISALFAYKDEIREWHKRRKRKGRHRKRE